MGKTAEDIQLDSTKTLKALFMAVGWNASPAGALIYAMSKYCALMGRANTCSSQVSCVIDIVARHYGIHIPERVKGKGR